MAMKPVAEKYADDDDFQLVQFQREQMKESTRRACTTKLQTRSQANKARCRTIRAQAAPIELAQPMQKKVPPTDARGMIGYLQFEEVTVHSSLIICFVQSHTEMMICAAPSS